MKIAVIFGSTTGNTEAVAEKIGQKLGADIFNVADVEMESLIDFDLLVLGSSTWGVGELQDDWIDALDGLKGLDLNGKKFALFGLGDQESYADSFISGLFELNEAAVSAGASRVGEWSTQGYDFSDSEAVEGDQFIGLALDEDNQPELTDERIEKWVESLS